MPEIIDPFLRQLDAILVEELDKRMVSLAEGSAKVGEHEAGTVAEKYAAQVSYIQALRNIRDRCIEIQTEIYGSRKSTNDHGQ